MTKKFKNAFTLAEVLITLSIIGIVAALTIPGVVKHHNEKAWATGQDLFIKKLEVALKSMNTDGKLSGYTTTSDFVNELKKNIKITKVCPDDVTRCFSKNITWGLNKEISATITNNAITYSTRGGQDWAETVGIQFSNGITALIAYNKKCYADPYDNLGSVNEKCLGLIYDVTGNSKPNVYGNDIMVNANVTRINGKGLCVYQMANGTCFSKILAPKTGYSGLPMTVGSETIYCSTVKDELGISACLYGETDQGYPAPSYYDYWAGAVYACGGRTKLPDQATIQLLTQELYNDPNILARGIYGKYNSDGSCSWNACTNDFAFESKKAALFLALSPGGSDAANPTFSVWSSVEYDNNFAYFRIFRSNYTHWYNNLRLGNSTLAVCLGD